MKIGLAKGQDYAVDDRAVGFCAIGRSPAGIWIEGVSRRYRESVRVGFASDEVMQVGIEMAGDRGEFRGAETSLSIERTREGIGGHADRRRDIFLQ